MNSGADFFEEDENVNDGDSCEALDEDDLVETFAEDDFVENFCADEFVVPDFFMPEKDKLECTDDEDEDSCSSSDEDESNVNDSDDESNVNDSSSSQGSSSLSGEYDSPRLYYASPSGKLNSVLNTVQPRAGPRSIFEELLCCPWGSSWSCPNFSPDRCPWAT